MNTEKKNLQFRRNVGLMIINRQGLVWMGTRADGQKFRFNEQMPQGGIEPNETLLDAAYRELQEETGLPREKVKLLAKSKYWYKYRFPHPITFGTTTYLGQTQKWFLFLYTGDGSDFNLTAHPEEIEFVSYKWYAPEKITQLAVPFKRAVYQKIVSEFSDTIQKIAQNSPQS